MLSGSAGLAASLTGPGGLGAGLAKASGPPLLRTGRFKLPAILFGVGHLCVGHFVDDVNFGTNLTLDEAWALDHGLNYFAADTIAIHFVSPLFT